MSVTLAEVVTRANDLADTVWETTLAWASIPE